MIILLIVGLLTKMLLYKMIYFPERNSCNKNKRTFELDLSN